MKALLRRISFSAFALWVTCCTGVAATYTLTINTNGNGSVARNPTNSVYPQGSVVTLTALPATNWAFTGWSGDITGTLNPTNVTMNADKVITANFSQIPNYTLTINISGNGSVAPPGGIFQSNTVVPLTATPSNGWAFHHWSGDASGGTNPLHVTMNTNKNITAVFFQPPSISSQPSGGSANIGSSFSFSVGATGSPPITYQWLFNNVAVSNATTATLTLANLQTGNGGNYQVVVSNPYGNATSTVAILIVNCPGTNVVSVATDPALRAAMAIGGNVRLCFSGTLTITNTININKNVTLDASGTSVIVSGGDAVRLFNVNTGVLFQATNVFFANGHYVEVASGVSAEGAAIKNNGGTVRLMSCTLSNHVVIAPDTGGEGRGGAIYNAGGTVELHTSLLVSNSAVGGTNGGAGGGGIYSTSGKVTLTNSGVIGNRAFVVAGPIGVPVTGANTARGGAIFQAGGTMILDSSKLHSNTARGGDAQMGVVSQVPPGHAAGGALYVQGGSLTIRRSSITANEAAGGNAYRHSGTGEADGGAIYNAGQLQVIDTQLSANRSVAGSGSSVNSGGFGGAFYNAGSTIITGSTLDNNTAIGGSGGQFATPAGWPGADGFGGGIYNRGTLTMTNCTLAQNTARGGNPGGVGASSGSAFGGGIFTTNGTIVLMNTTIATNSVIPGIYFGAGGLRLGANIANTNGSFTLRNSLVAYPGTDANAWGAIIDGGYNMSSDGSANFSSGTSFNFTDPKLLPLANNGGPTLTMALLSDSPAIDWAPAAGAPKTDQRGFPRPYDAGVDVGAFELGPGMPSLIARRSGTNIDLSFAGQVGLSYRIERSPDLSTWGTLETTGVFGTNGIVSRSYPATQPQQFYRLTLDF